ncbi:amidohydrolase [Aminipila butyrica]|uniref:Amidohydrolase n=1 Tax=Aminipila butyrica TaxID=433296 RepID=A0A858BUR4_9FIRM|nr:amidohydrolase [Aminipila butyrica]QIB68929.1 amidohydrolase [Aminipila butyrica]
MDTIFYNGRFKTMDKINPEIEAVAVKNGIITRTGKDEEILALAKAHTKKIDLGGRFALPGFSDSHLHLIYYANTKRKVELSQAKSIEEVVDLCKAGIQEEDQGDEWLLGCGWNQDDWNVPVFPTRADLDKVSEDIPVAITRTCYHATVVNSKALEVLGLEKDIPILSNGIVEVDKHGKANGILRESAQNIIWNRMGVPDIEDLKDRIEDACLDAASKGITAIQTDDFETFTGDTMDLVIRAYKELVSEERLPIRIYQQCLLRTPEKLQGFLDKGYKTGYEFGFYKIGPLKLLNDGSLGARTAHLRKPYWDDPSTSGVPLYDQEKLTEMIKMGHENGMQIAIHCIGDAAIEMAVNSFEKVMLESPRIDPRHGIVHCQITDLDLIERIKKLNLLIYAQPIFIRADRQIINQRVGTELGNTSYNWRAYADRNIHISGGSDCPVEKFDSIPNIYCAVTGKNPENDSDPPWHPENCLTVDETIKSFTAEGAYAAFQENERGTISVGKYADMVVLSGDIYRIPESQIKNIQVEMTIVNGEIKYSVS